MEFIEPNDLSGLAALMAADATPLKKQPGERDTEFVKRLVAAYINCHNFLDLNGTQQILLGA